MKKSLIAIAALAAVSASFAQSTVTIGGIMDVGVRNATNVAPGAATTSVGVGNNNRINFSIVEDLGGGLKAIANVGMRFDAATGLAESSGARPLFQGETRVGVSGGFGSIMLGRGFSALAAANGGNSDPFGVTTVGGTLYATGFATDYAAGGEARIDQGIFYTSPSISGFSVSSSYSPRKLTAAGVAAVADNTGTGVQGTNAVTAITTSKTHLSLLAMYANGPAAIGLGMEQNRVGDKITQAFGNYDFGIAKLFSSYALIKGGNAADRAGVTFAAAASGVQSGGSAKQVAVDGTIRNFTIGATAPLASNLTLRTGYSRWNGNGAVGQVNDSKFGVGVKYDLSKRTYLYTTLANLTRKNNTVTASESTSNTNVRSFDVGVAHSF